VEENFQWQSGRGLTIERVVIKSIEYDEATKEKLKTAQEMDMMGRGNRANTFMQVSAARGIEAMGSNEGGAGGAMGVGFMNMGMGAAGNMMQGLQQAPGQPPQMGHQQPQFDPHTGQPLNQQQPMFDPMTGQPLQQQPQPQFDPMTGQPLNQQPAQPTAAPADDPVAKLTQMKQLLDAGVISQEEFEAAKKNFLGM